MKDFDEGLPADRTFKIAGETFHWHFVRPEALTAFDPAAEVDENDVNAGWKTVDNRILQFLSADQHDKWREVRLRDDNPITGGQLQDLVTWLLEEQTQRPTQAPSPLASGRSKTAVTSKAA